ncbi:hypothetical protein CBS101457_002194 [Exobasidium rhododendri]|nr:hypothetical protein CBS101457_002194 [Exobasidium rhododendri]
MSANAGGSSGDSSMMNGQLSPGQSPGRSVSSGSKAVKDRIARFQDHNHEKPLIPKSSFGAPTPMGSERNPNAHRPYPGATASGGGSGQWGEGVLRPQLTGGTWVGGGEGRGWADTSNLRPQMTGSPWLGAGGTTPPGTSQRLKAGSYSPVNSLPRTPTRQRDAFLDLDEDAVSLTKRDSPRRGSSFSEAQMAAASKGLARVASASSHDGSEVGMSESQEIGSIASTLLSLPDTPSKKNGLLDVPGRREGSLESNSVDSNIPILPSPPTEKPIISLDIPRRDTSKTGDIEIGVAGASPAKFAQIQRKLSASLDEARMRRSSPEELSGTIPTSPPPFLGELRSSNRSNTGPSSASSDGGVAGIGRLAIRSDEENDEEGSSRSASLVSPIKIKSSTPIKSPTSRQNGLPYDSAASIDDQSISSEAGKQLPGRLADATLHTSLDSEPRAVTSERTKALYLADHRPESGILDPHGPGSTLNRNGVEHLTNSTSSSSSSTNGTLKASNSAATVSILSKDESVAKPASPTSKEACSIGRSKSQRVKKPPVGRPMTAAEMDASDDDYEPGWASVISTSRTQV